VTYLQGGFSDRWAEEEEEEEIQRRVGRVLVLTDPPATLWSRVLSAVLMGMMSCGITGRIFCPPASS